MTTQAAVPATAPVMVAWEAYKQTDEFANTKQWLEKGSPTQGDGELWAAFYQGFYAAAFNAAAAPPSPPAIEVTEEMAKAALDTWFWPLERDKSNRGKHTAGDIRGMTNALLAALSARR